MSINVKHLIKKLSCFNSKKPRKRSNTNADPDQIRQNYYREYMKQYAEEDIQRFEEIKRILETLNETPSTEDFPPPDPD